MRHIAFTALVFVVLGCGSTATEHISTAVVCVAHSGLPDQYCTPGAVFSNATTAQICAPGYAQSVRNVPQSVKNRVYAEYGIKQHKPGEYEIDHLISLELGGSNDIKNLWPEPYVGPHNAHIKDDLENVLHAQVCNGKMQLQEAQAEIAKNWEAI